MRFPKSIPELLGWYGAYVVVVLLLRHDPAAANFWILLPAVLGTLAAMGVGVLFILAAAFRHH